jgi:hypothetical protein
VKKLILATALAVGACLLPIGCANQNGVKPTTQDIEYGVIKSFNDAVRVLNAAYLFGTYSKAEHDAIKPFVDGATDALDRYNKDVKAGNVAEAQRDLNAFNEFSKKVLDEASKVQKGQK